MDKGDAKSSIPFIFSYGRTRNWKTLISQVTNMWFWIPWYKERQSKKVNRPHILHAYFILDQYHKGAKSTIKSFFKVKNQLLKLRFYKEATKNNEIFQLIWHLFKAKFTQVSTFFHEHIFLPWEFFLIKKFEIEKTKTTFVISVLKVVY